ncbi:MAG: hypothetical protein JNM85_07615 [Chthonomonas sp.]|nr:hypothetical protein [Chthonomonas sp.]
MSKAEVWLAFLTERQFSPESLPGGEIRFTVDENVFVLHPEPDDASYFKLSFYHVWDKDQPAASHELLEELNMKVKCVKLWVQADVLCVTCEAFYADATQATAMFDRYMTQIYGAVQVIQAGHFPD